MGQGLKEGVAYVLSVSGHCYSRWVAGWLNRPATLRHAQPPVYVVSEGIQLESVGLLWGLEHA